jgi:hypothetical protein
VVSEVWLPDEFNRKGWVCAENRPATFEFNLTHELYDPIGIRAAEGRERVGIVDDDIGALFPNPKTIRRAGLMKPIPDLILERYPHRHVTISPLLAEQSDRPGGEG